MSFPRIDPAKKNDDGTWSICVHRSPDEFETITYENRSAALAGADALKLAWRLGGFGGPKIEHVRGPHKDGPTYVLRWTENGASRIKRGERKDLSDLRRKLLGSKKSSEDLRKRSGFGSVTYWKASMSDALEANRKAVNDRDYEAIKATKMRIDALAAASAAYLPHAGYQDLESNYEDLLKFHEDASHRVDMEEGAQLQQQASGLGSTLSTAEGPETALRKPGDPVPN